MRPKDYNEAALFFPTLSLTLPSLFPPRKVYLARKEAFPHSLTRQSLRPELESERAHPPVRSTRGAFSNGMVIASIKCSVHTQEREGDK